MTHALRRADVHGRVRQAMIRYLMRVRVDFADANTFEAHPGKPVAYAQPSYVCVHVCVARGGRSEHALASKPPRPESEPPWQRSKECLGMRFVSSTFNARSSTIAYVQVLQFDGAPC